eukprot:CAMPEP_0113917962 /NCGR_PEP_ID=MMETSP0780_2-20120614/33042_1 /TAXON_ID=652834 /ORGANISM="Palpitomonas bilix" /LENGTH=311 /DNA_ID=CAMNT_0000917627 /DNA_START=410 /DNA_END=1345 /DNA_ORIENTATION=- /assembly_acc=CAM_ASM_000599
MPELTFALIDDDVCVVGRCLEKRFPVGSMVTIEGPLTLERDFEGKGVNTRLNVYNVRKEEEGEERDEKESGREVKGAREGGGGGGEEKGKEEGSEKEGKERAEQHKCSLTLPFYHSPICPSMMWERQGGEVKRDGNWVRIAASVLVLDREGRMLITRRSPKLRNYANFCVLPGGHVDGGETIKRAAVREVMEETGVELDESELIPLCFWESTSPHQLDGSVPRRQHIIAFFVAKLDHDAHTIANPDEVSQVIWISPSTFVMFEQNAKDPRISDKEKDALFTLAMGHQAAIRLHLNEKIDEDKLISFYSSPV